MLKYIEKLNIASLHEQLISAKQKEFEFCKFF